MLLTEGINGVLIVVLQPFAAEIVGTRSRPLVLALASLVLGIGFGLNTWVGTALEYAGAIAVWTIGRFSLRRRQRHSSRIWHALNRKINWTAICGEASESPRNGWLPAVASAEDAWRQGGMLRRIHY